MIPNSHILRSMTYDPQQSYSTNPSYRIIFCHKLQMTDTQSPIVMYYTALIHVPCDEILQITPFPIVVCHTTHPYYMFLHSDTLQMTNTCSPIHISNICAPTVVCTHQLSMFPVVIYYTPELHLSLQCYATNRWYMLLHNHNLQTTHTTSQLLIFNRSLVYAPLQY